MNIVLFTHEFPYPLTNGGRIDIWNRIKVFKNLNHKVFLISWVIYDDSKNPENIKSVDDLVDELYLFPRKSNYLRQATLLIKKFIFLLIQPTVVTNCMLSHKTRLKVLKQIKDFNPDIIFVDGIYSAKQAFLINKTVKIPIFVRSHNIEHLYIEKQKKHAYSIFEKLKLFGISANLKSYEKFVLGNATGFFDISLVDLGFLAKSRIENRTLDATCLSFI